MSVADMLEDAEQLVDWYDHAARVDRENAELADRQELTRLDVDRSLEAHAVVDMLAGAFRRHHFPRAGRVIVAMSEVYVLSPKGRSRVVFGSDYPRLREPQPEVVKA